MTNISTPSKPIPSTIQAHQGITSSPAQGVMTCYAVQLSASGCRAGSAPGIVAVERRRPGLAAVGRRFPVLADSAVSERRPGHALQGLRIADRAEDHGLPFEPAFQVQGTSLVVDPGLVPDLARRVVEAEARARVADRRRVLLADRAAVVDARDEV